MQSSQREGHQAAPDTAWSSGWRRPRSRAPSSPVNLDRSPSPGHGTRSSETDGGNWIIHNGTATRTAKAGLPACRRGPAAAARDSGGVAGRSRPGVTLCESPHSTPVKLVAGAGSSTRPPLRRAAPPSRPEPAHIKQSGCPAGLGPAGPVRSRRCAGRWCANARELTQILKTADDCRGAQT